MKKLYSWANDCEGGYVVCDESNDLTNHEDSFGDITYYHFIGEFQTRDELTELLKNENNAELDVEFWTELLYKEAI